MCWQYRYAAEFRFGGEKRFLGSWTSYNTTYQLYEVDIDMDVLRLTGFNGQQSTYDYVRQRFQLPDWDSAEAAHVTLTAWVGDTIINPASEPSWPSFERVHMETTSRGTFPTRGVIECGFCGDSTCDPIRHETPGSCTADCGFCGDGICWFGEDHNNCGQDCRPPPVCGDGICDSEEMWTGCGDCPPPCFAAKC